MIAVFLVTIPVSAVLLVAACSRPPPAPPEPPPPPMAAWPSQPPPTPAASLLHRQFAASVAQEPAAVLSAQATPNLIAEITAADRAARAAVAPLEHPGRRPSQRELAHAQAAVARLQAAVGQAQP